MTTKPTVHSSFFPEVPTLSELGMKGAEPVGLNNAEFRKLLAAETKQLSTVIRDSKISVD